MISTTIKDEAHWHEMRRACVITASTVAALFGCHPYESALGVYQRAIGEGQPVEKNRMMALGHAAELMAPSLAELERPGIGLAKCTTFHRHAKLAFGGTPDFVDEVGGIWQCKCLDPSVFARDWKDGPPLHVLIQHQAEMMLTGATNGGVIAILRDRNFTTMLHDVAAHDATQDRIVAAVAAFAKRVEAREPPKADYGKDAALLADLHADAIKGKTVDMAENNRLPLICAEYLQLGEVEKDAGAKREALRAELLEIIGDAAAATTRGFRISMPTIIKPEKEVPAHTQPESRYRRLTIKEIA